MYILPLNSVAQQSSFNFYFTKEKKKTGLSFTHASLRLVRGVGDSFRSLPIQTVP